MYTAKDVVKILKNIGVELPEDISSVRLIEDGLMDSLQIMQLFMEIEDSLGIRIDQTEVNPDNLESIETVVAMMNRLVG